MTITRQPSPLGMFAVKRLVGYLSRYYLKEKGTARARVCVCVCISISHLVIAIKYTGVLCCCPTNKLKPNVRLVCMKDKSLEN